MSAEKKPYEVGYGRPPKSTQFQKGKSGNARGRPKGAQNLSAIAHEEMSGKIVVTENGRSILMSRGRIVVKQHVAKAMKGDPRAAEFLLKLDRSSENGETQGPASTPFTEDDQAIIDRFFASRQVRKEDDDASK